MMDFWLSCGHHLLDRDGDLELVPTDEFLKAYLARPELRPPPDGCAAERALHAALLQAPRRYVRDDEIAAIADQDARENWLAMLCFRDRLLRYRTLEAAYLDLACRGAGTTPPLFLDQLVHVILRNALDSCEDPFVLRAAELFFRRQRIAIHDRSLIAADEERIARAGAAPLSPLVSMLGFPAWSEIDVLVDNNAHAYWHRSDTFDFALDLTPGRRGLAALGEVMTRWIKHMLKIDVAIEPLTEMQGVNLRWYVGLDAIATDVGNALWNGEQLDDQRRYSIVGLYRLSFANPGDVIAEVRGEPVYLLLAMDGDKSLRMKPQNLLTGLPIVRREVRL